MGTDDLPEDVRTEVASGALPAWPSALVWRIAGALLVIGAILQIIALSLPWEHLDLVEYHQGMDIFVSTFISSSTAGGMLGGAFVPEVGFLVFSPFPTAWDIFWQSALVFLGLLIVLAFLLAQRLVLRWTFAVLYGLWLLYTTVLALSYGATAQAVNAGTYVVPAQPTWWEQLAQVSVELSGPTDPLSPAWGYWVYIGALVLCWLALGFAIFMMVRGRDHRHTGAGGDSPARKRRAWLAVVLITVGAIVWVTSLVALPMLVTDCSRPLQTPTPTMERICRTEAVLYPLQVSARGLQLSVIPPIYNTPATVELPSHEILEMIAYFLDFGLLVLAMAAMPLVVVAVWRARVARGAAACVTIWAALVLVETGFVFHVVTLLLPPPGSSPAYAPGIGPGAVLVPLGALLIATGVVRYWFHLRGS